MAPAAVFFCLSLLLCACALISSAVSMPQSTSSYYADTPTYAWTHTLSGDSTPFSRLRVDTSLSNVAPPVLLTAASLIVLDSTSSTTPPSVSPVPPEYSSVTALITANTAGDGYYLRFQPISSPGELLSVPCAFSPFSCDFNSATSAPTAAGNYTDMIGIAASDSVSVFLFTASDYTTLRCVDSHCASHCPHSSSSTCTTSFAVPHYPILASAHAFAGSVGEPFMFITLLSSTADSSPGALVSLVANSGYQSVVYLPPTPAVTLALVTTTTVFITAYNDTSDDSDPVVLEFDVTSNQFATAPFTMTKHTEVWAAGVYVPGGRGTGHNAAFFTTADSRSPSTARLYSYELVGMVATSAGVELPDAVTVSQLLAANTNRDYVWIAARPASGGNGLVYLYTAEHLDSEGAEWTESRHGGRQGEASSSIWGEGSGQDSDQNSSSEGEGSVSSTCTRRDPTLPPLCVVSCEPPPAMVCGPTVLPPQGMSCYVMTSRMDACNYCPPAWANTCNSGS